MTSIRYHARFSWKFKVRHLRPALVLHPQAAGVSKNHVRRSFRRAKERTPNLAESIDGAGCETNRVVLFTS